jgi:Divergent InlB B-repeat domain
MTYKLDKTILKACLNLIFLLFPAFSMAQEVFPVAISNPPATAEAGTGFDVTDYVWNMGTGASRQNATVQFDLVDSRNIRAATLGTRIVPLLPSSGVSSRITRVTIPLNVSGSYYLRSCVLERGPCDPSVTVKSRTMIQVARPTLFTLTLRFTGDGGGTVQTPAGPTSRTLSINVPSGSDVTLTQSADDLSEFARWTTSPPAGTTCSINADCKIKMTSNKTVTIDFRRRFYLVTVKVTTSGPGAGSVTGGPEFQSPEIVDCRGGTCGTFKVRAASNCVDGSSRCAAVLVAAPLPASVSPPPPPPPPFPRPAWVPPPSIFSGWSGDCSGPPILRIIPNRDITCTANFRFP